MKLYPERRMRCISNDI